ncbi:hypothetical protein N8691_01600 [Candidatus Pelagibacter sp.]|nr:hypothetical protein [Candidatus Pelagibacter sp.]
MKSVIRNNKFNLFFILLISIVYYKYIFFVGFSPGDDYGHINLTKEYPGILENILKNFYITPARPIGGLMIGLVHPIFTDNIVYFNLISLTLWILTALILKNTFQILINKKFSELFFIIFSFPYLCFSIFYGNLLFAYYILFLFFWSISFFFQVKFYENNNKKNLFFYYLFLIFAILTFELIISLLVINLLIPFYYKKKISLFIYNLLIIISLCVVFLIYKIYFIPNTLDIPAYGVSKLNYVSILQGIYFFYSIIVENLILLIESTKFALNIVSVFVLLLLILLFKNFTFEKILSKKIILYIFILSLISNFLIFFISGYPAVTYGHYNKMMVPAFFSITFIVSYLFMYFNFNRFFLIIFVFLVINSTYSQINNYAEATRIKNDLVIKLTYYIKKNNLDNEDTVIINSPLFVKNNYNNEEIVFTTWDLRDIILYKTNKRLNPWLVSDRLINNPNYYPNHNFLNSKYFKDNSFNQTKLFYFQYDPELSSFEIFNNKIEFEKKIKSLKDKKTNEDNFIFREKIRLFLKKIIFQLI